MRYRLHRLLSTSCLLAALLFSCDHEATSAPKGGSAAPAVRLESIAKGLSQPLGLFPAVDGSGRLFIVEQGGTIRVWEKGAILERPFLDIRDRVTAGGEKGLLGLAFHPKFSENRRLFVNYTSPEGGLHTVISEFKAGDPLTEADPKRERILLTIPQPFANHNGGNIVFGSDGKLYIGMGDGGAANDPRGNGQNLGALLGKMLRIDVDSQTVGKGYGIPPDNPFVSQSSAAPEVWAYGLRNPWRFSFDPTTGLLYVGDVGQDDREEIDVVHKGGNYGWNVMEGTICTPGVNPVCDKSRFEPPILDYPRSDGITVIGGYVYRGSAIPFLAGAYLYGDFGSGRVWMLRYDGKKVIEQQLLLDTKRRISSFGEDAARELYLVDYAGEVLKFVPQGPK
ncbi:MAG: PQQ-dependent sugar dehydrogenase [Nitrospirae bacterium]|nr:PQQ-dependent sugar dehydrogenase [Candidatus Manganitrophaceae bacterium]